LPRPYRVEREQMPPGSVVQLYRVIVRLPGKNSYGTVQVGLSKPDAEDLLQRLLDNEAQKQRQRILYGGGFRR